MTANPGKPLLEFDGRPLEESATITVREKNELIMNCVVRRASTAVKHVHWFVGDTNVTHASKLLMEYSAEEDVSMAISVLTINVTRDDHKRQVVCHALLTSWLNDASASASLNVLCMSQFALCRYVVMKGLPIK